MGHQSSFMCVIHFSMGGIEADHVKREEGRKGGREEGRKEGRMERECVGRDDRIEMDDKENR